MQRFHRTSKALALARTNLAETQYSLLLTLGLAAINIVVNIGATTAFAISGRSDTIRNFIIWQLIGSGFGLATQLTFAGMVRFSSVQIASAVGIGLAFVSAEVVTSHAFFQEPFTRLQWIGVGVAFVGLMLLIWGRN